MACDPCRKKRAKVRDKPGLNPPPKNFHSLILFIYYIGSVHSEASLIDYE
ncbi:hypothetical protein VFPBJ_11142 [Purpureocillium lilacinum]|uniref:Uncharacterized protein n=1 Tax=Purpureocillium lilacinum TaxID=33203 RepID=A0A179FK71_PURLI|nr:hypothetical protein VFPBJ_11142 [Purpureocillium lilacinum]